MKQRIRYSEFLKDVFLLSVTCFGGPQAHIAHFQNVLVQKRNYISENELIELNALCQVVPGPSSTQTLSAIGYRLGGAKLAYLTLLIWMLPSVAIMTIGGILINSFANKNASLEFTRFIQPMAVGFVAYAAYAISLKTVTTKRGLIIMILAGVATYFSKSPVVFPLILLVAGLVTALNYKAHPRQKKQKFDVSWANFFLWAGVLIFAALLGAATKSIPEFLPIRLFENFYRNGSLIFGGGQVLTPMLYTEFVQYAPKQYLTSEEFLSGYAFVQGLPGPVFSFSSYIGALAMRDYGIAGEVIGAIMSAAGIFLPGTFLIFFMIRIWESLKKFRPIRASLEGINAANAGLVVAAAVLLFQPLVMDQSTSAILTNIGFAVVTFLFVAFTKIPSWVIIIIGLGCGFVM
ncbi:MAG TPA: chromate efflux transporter [Cyclobacteriaceae bacterium]|nr:chromate efflux transporter [Cyclobacteriaceae bacterium]HRE67553.1 chromate efflux transporter [Cyclobacteriaceae bacterium]HRF33340.1 chromate efflux transporter [Cyclobacteriaceae bacterium]